MGKRKGGLRKRSKCKLKKDTNAGGRLSLTGFFAEFKPGERVVLKAEPSVHKGSYHTRFHGHVGTVKSKQGRCYKITIMDGSKEKILIVNPVHLRKAQ